MSKSLARIRTINRVKNNLSGNLTKVHGTLTVIEAAINGVFRRRLRISGVRMTIPGVKIMIGKTRVFLATDG